MIVLKRWSNQDDTYKTQEFTSWGSLVYDQVTKNRGNDDEMIEFLGYIIDNPGRKTYCSIAYNFKVTLNES